MIETEIKSNAAAVAVRYDKAPTLIASTIVKVFRRIGAGLEGHVRKEKLQGQVLKRRTATLMRAIYTKISLAGSEAILILGADRKKAVYSAIHEFGGEVVPKTAQNLAIPLDAARTKAGVARMSAREFFDNPQGLGFTRAFVNPKGTAIMGATDDRVVPVFALKKRVRIPERSYLRSTVQDRRGWILAELGLGTQEAIQQALEFE